MGSHLTAFYRDEFGDRWEEMYERFMAAPITEMARYPGGLLGTAMIETGTGPAAHAGTLRVHVRKAARGMGTGTWLLERVLKQADESGIERIVATPYLKAGQFWPILPEAHAKVAFFRRYGFTFEGLAEKFARLEDGTFTHAALMARVR